MSSWPPGASEGGLRGTLQVALEPPCQIPRMSSEGSGDEFRQVNFGGRLQTNGPLAGIGGPFGSKLGVQLTGIGPIGPKKHFWLEMGRSPS